MSTFTLFFILVVLLLAYAIISRKRPSQLVPHIVVAVLALLLYDGVVRDRLFSTRQTPDAMEPFVRGEELCRTPECLRELIHSIKAVDIESLAPLYRRINGNLLRASRSTADSIRVFVITDEMEQVVRMTDGNPDSKLPIDDRIDHYFYRGFALSRLEQYDAALAAFEQAQKIRPNNAGLTSFVASSLEDMGRIAEAESAYVCALEIEPKHYPALASLGRLMLLSHRDSQAVQYLEAAVDAYPSGLYTRQSLGFAYKRLGRFVEAESVLVAVYHEAPEDADVLSTYGGVLIELRRTEEALKILELSISLDSTDAYTFTYLGRAYEGQRQPDRAIECYRRSLKLDSTDFISRIYLARLLEANHCLEDALHEFEAAYNTATEELEPLKGMVRLNIALGRGPNVIAAAVKWADRDTSNVDAALAAAVGYQLSSRPENALNLFQEILKIDSNQVQAMTGVAYMLLELDRNDEAMRAAERAVAADSNDIGVRMAYIACLTGVGEFDRACDKAQALFDSELRDNGPWLYELASACARAGRRTETFRYLTRSVLLDSASKYLARSDSAFTIYQQDPEFVSLIGPKPRAPQN